MDATLSYKTLEQLTWMAIRLDRMLKTTDPGTKDARNLLALRRALREAMEAKRTK